MIRLSQARSVERLVAPRTLAAQTGFMGPVTWAWARGGDRPRASVALVCPQIVSTDTEGPIDAMSAGQWSRYRRRW
jgi:hypothetical protein